MKPGFTLCCLALLLRLSLTAQLGPGDIRSAGSNYSEYLFRTLKESTQSARTDNKIETFNDQENTEGKRFLFDRWVRGDSLVNPDGSLTDAGSFYFNFDKMTGHVLVTANKKDMLTVSPTHMHSVVLDDNGQRLRLWRVDAIDSTRFFVALATDSPSRSLFKGIHTKFSKANFRDDGVVQTGNRYDTYKDNDLYYLVDKAHNMFRFINFKPKLIRAVLVAEKVKTEEYLKQHRSEPINEAFLIGLINFVNRP